MRVNRLRVGGVLGAVCGAAVALAAFLGSWAYVQTYAPNCVRFCVQAWGDSLSDIPTVQLTTPTGTPLPDEEPLCYSYDDQGELLSEEDLTAETVVTGNDPPIGRFKRWCWHWCGDLLPGESVKVYWTLPGTGHSGTLTHTQT